MSSPCPRVKQIDTEAHTKYWRETLNRTLREAGVVLPAGKIYGNVLWLRACVTDAGTMPRPADETTRSKE